MAITKFELLSNTIVPSDPTVAGTPTHYVNYGIGGLKSFDDSFEFLSSEEEIGSKYGGSVYQLLNKDKITTGSITYLAKYDKYYMWSGSKWAELPALTTGAPTFPGLTSSAGIHITNGHLFLDNGNISASGTLQIGENSTLGTTNTNTTTVFGNLLVNHDANKSGSIRSDMHGNLLLDSSGNNTGVQITDGRLWLGVSGSTGIPLYSGSYGGTYNGGMISTSAKIVALHGFSVRTSDEASGFEVDTNGNLQCHSLKETSLRAYKHDIFNIQYGQLQNILKLNPVTFLYNEDVPQDVNDTKLRQAGFIAEQMQQVYPEVVWYKSGQLGGIQYQRLTAYLTRGIQQLIQQNTKIRHQLKLKDKSIRLLKKQMKQVKVQI